jgi:hypothetical protein
MGGLADGRMIQENLPRLQFLGQGFEAENLFIL